MKILLTGGRMIDPSQEIDEPADLLIENGKIVKTGKGQSAGSDAEVIDIGGMWLVPGLLDMHVHLREPGYEYKETVQTGSELSLIHI